MHFNHELWKSRGNMAYVWADEDGFDTHEIFALHHVSTQDGLRFASIAPRNQCSLSPFHSTLLILRSS